LHRSIEDYTPARSTDDRVGSIPQQGENLAGELGAFFVFLTHGHETDDGIPDPLHLPGVDGAHDGVVEEMQGFRVDIGSRVENVVRAMFVGQRRGDSRHVDAPQAAELDATGSDHGARVPGADDGLGIAGLHEVRGHVQGRFLLLLDRFQPGLAHADYLGGMDDLQFRMMASLRFQFALEAIFVADQVDPRDARERPESANGPLNRDHGSKVTSHGIECDLHGSDTLGDPILNAPATGFGGASWVVSAAGRAGNRREGLIQIHHHHLALAVMAAGRAGDVARLGATAFGAGLQQRLAPALGSPTHALFHFRGATLGNGHGRISFVTGGNR